MVPLPVEEEDTPEEETELLPVRVIFGTPGSGTGTGEAVFGVAPVQLTDTVPAFLVGHRTRYERMVEGDCLVGVPLPPPPPLPPLDAEVSMVMTRVLAHSSRMTRK